MSDKTTTYPPEEYTPLEKERISELRQACQNLQLSEEQKTDGQLMRWLRAQDMNVKKAHKMLEEHLRWREENQINGILQRNEVPTDLLRATQGAILGVNNQGYPIYLFPFGKQNTRSLLEKYGEEMVIKAMIINLEKIMETLRKASKEQGREVSQIIEIMDLDGFRFGDFTKKACMDFIMKTQHQIDNNYPEVLRSLVAINAPKLFHVLYRAFKPLMSKRQVEKIQVYGTDEDTWKKVIREKCPPELIPKHWGGDREGLDKYCSQDDIWLQGPMSLQFFEGSNSNVQDNDLSTVTIKPGDTFKISLDVKDNSSSIAYEFYCEKSDIDFQILDHTGKSILHLKRVETSFSTEKLYDTKVPVPAAGLYTVLFDNSYCDAASKTVLYKIKAVEASANSEN